MKITVTYYIGSGRTTFSHHESWDAMINHFKGKYVDYDIRGCEGEVFKTESTANLIKIEFADDILCKEK